MTKEEIIQLVQKINTTFNIDIMGVSKKHEVLYFRYYIASKLEIQDSADVLKRNISQVYSIRRKLLTVKFTPEFKAITKIIETLDPLLYEQFVEAARCRKKYYLPKDNKIKRMPLNEVMLMLRKNIHSPLWHKEIKSWSAKDWEILKSY